MSRSPKTVSFRIPGDSSSPRNGLLSSPNPPVKSPLASTQTRTTQDGRAPVSQAPDLVADIINRPQTVHSSKVRDAVSQPEISEPKNSPTRQRPSSCPVSEAVEVSKQQKSSSPQSPNRGIPSYVRLAHRMHGPTKTRNFSSSVRDRSPLLLHQDTETRTSKSNTTSIAREVRERTNSDTHEHVRTLKHDVSQLREYLLKVEEEIKNLNRGRNTLEISVQDIRRALSVNQQSISTQQKKSSRGEEDSSIKLLREESRVLSKGKRSIEQHLQIVKTHLQVLDTTRRNLKSKISSLSSSLDLDAQNFKVYDGPRSVRPDSVSRQRQYASGYQSKSSGDEAGKLCATTSGVISGSKAIRSEIKALIVSVQTSKNEAHKKISDAISQNVQDARAKKRDMLLERGQVRMAQNSTLHKIHEEEIALGIALGPVSEKHRSVSEKVERPLSQLRPASATEERENFKQTKRSLTRRLSASSERASQVSSTDKRLAVQLRDGTQTVHLDSQTLRVRKMSLDNRWVQ